MTLLVRGVLGAAAAPQQQRALSEICSKRALRPSARASASEGTESSGPAGPAHESVQRTQRRFTSRRAQGVQTVTAPVVPASPEPSGRRMHVPEDQELRRARISAAVQNIMLTLGEDEDPTPKLRAASGRRQAFQERFSLNLAVRGLGDAGEWRAAHRLVRWMDCSDRTEEKPNDNTFAALFVASRTREALLACAPVWQRFLPPPSEQPLPEAPDAAVPAAAALPGTAGCTALICALARAGEPGDAMAVYRRMPGSGLRRAYGTYCAALLALSVSGPAEAGESYLRAKRVAREMAAAGVPMTPYALSLLVRGASAAGEWRSAVIRYEAAVRDGLAPDAPLRAAMAVVYAHAGLWSRARAAYDAARAAGGMRTVKEFNSFLAAAAVAGRFAEAELVIAVDMPSAGVAPDVHSYTALITAAARDAGVGAAPSATAAGGIGSAGGATTPGAGAMGGAVPWSKAEHSQMAAWREQQHARAQGAVRGNADGARRALAALESSGLVPTVTTVGAYVMALGSDGDWAGCQAAHARCAAWGVEPNLHVYNNLIGAALAAFEVPAALAMFDRLVAQGLVPSAATFSGLIAAVDGFGLAGRAQSLRELRESLRACGMLAQGAGEGRRPRPAAGPGSGAAWLAEALREAEEDRQELEEASERSGGRRGARGPGGGSFVVPSGRSAFTPPPQPKRGDGGRRNTGSGGRAGRRGGNAARS